LGKNNFSTFRKQLLEKVGQNSRQICPTFFSETYCKVVFAQLFLQFVLTINNNYTKLIIFYFITISNKIIVFIINETITNYS
jgi:hypothetical protein